MQTLVSVIIPTYNRAHSVLQAVETAAQQTHANLEIIVVDDASTDNTLAHLFEKQRDDTRLKIIRHQQNSGVSVARNTGILAAHGEYICLLDSDDQWIPTKIERQLESAATCSKDEPVLYGCNIFSRQIDPAGQIVVERITDYADDTLGNGWFTLQPSTWMAHRDTFEQVGLFDPEMHCGEDVDWQTRLLRQSGKIKIVSNPLSFYAYKQFPVYPKMESSIYLLLHKHGEWLAAQYPDSFRYLLQKGISYAEHMEKSEMVDALSGWLKVIPQPSRADNPTAPAILAALEK